jgi:DNA repair exonuclease SbcCD ATPase subunit
MDPAIFGDVVTQTTQTSGGFASAFDEAFNDVNQLGLFEQGGDRGPSSTELQERLTKFKSDVEEMMRSVNLRHEKLTQKIFQLEDRLAQIQKENTERHGFVTNRMKERQNLDSKVEALIERHNQIVMNFETRLHQAQRVIDEQSVQISKQHDRGRCQLTGCLLLGACRRCQQL